MSCILPPVGFKPGTSWSKSGVPTTQPPGHFQKGIDEFFVLHTVDNKEYMSC